MAHSADDQFPRVLENNQCGKDSGLYKDVKSAKEQCIKKSSCRGVSVIGCDEKNEDVRLCDAEYGFAYSKRGTCVYEKKGKCLTSLNILLF